MIIKFVDKKSLSVDFRKLKAGDAVSNGKLVWLVVEDKGELKYVELSTSSIVGTVKHDIKNGSDVDVKKAKLTVTVEEV